MTGSDGERATFFLESSNWNLDVAVSSFFENDMGAAAAAAGAPAGDDAVPMEAEQVAETASRATEGEGPSQRPAAARGVGLNVAGIGGLASGGNESKDSSDSDDEPGQAFYAGGSTSSGQQILGPPKKKGADFVKDVFKKARESGAEQAEASSSRKPNQHQPAFTGTGFKLGSSESDPSQKVEGAKKAKVNSFLVLAVFKLQVIFET